MLDWILDPNAWIALLTLAALEIVLGIEFFLVLIGVTLIGDGFNPHIPKGYIYFAMVYPLIVDLLNLKIRRQQMA